MKVSECILLGQNTALQEMSLIGPSSSKLIMTYQQQNIFTAKSKEIMSTSIELGMESEERVNGMKVTNMAFNEVRQDVTTQYQSTISATNLNLLH